MGIPKPRVAILGTGRMGSAIAKRLAREGYGLVLWNRTRRKAERLANEVNAEVAYSPEDAVGRAEIAVLALADDNALFSVLSAIRRMDGLVVINMGTHTPRGVEYASNYVRGNGGCYVESPIVGGPGTVEKGSPILLVAGTGTCVRQAREVLDSLVSTNGKIIFVGEKPGLAQALKLSFNNLLINTVNALAESLRLTESYGVNIEHFRELLEGTVFSGIAEKYIDRMRRPPEERASFTLELAAKDLFYALQAAYDSGEPLYATAATYSKYREAVLEGLGAADYTRIYWKGKRIEGKEEG